MVKNVLFLAGAPDAELLEWDESGLSRDFNSPARRFLGDEKIDSTQLALTAASYPLAKWRDVSLKQNKDTALFGSCPSPYPKTAQPAIAW
jgi:hypothetical protein